MAGASRVEVARVTNATPQIATRSPTYAAFTGIAAMGPIGAPGVADSNGGIPPTTSWAEWSALYGGFSANAQDLPLAVKNFFDEGGRLCYTSRVVHCTTATDPTTATSAKAGLTLATDTVAASPGVATSSLTGPYPLASGDTLLVKVDGAGAATTTFAGTAAARESASDTFALSDGDTLTLTSNGVAVTVTFVTSAFADIANATAPEVVAAINAKLASLNPSARAEALITNTDKVTIRTTWKGTGASLNITGGTANAGKLAFTTGALAGGGNVVDIDAVTVAEMKTLIEAAVSGCTVSNAAGATRITSNTTGGSSSIQVTATSTADTKVGFDNAVHTGGASGSDDTLQVDALWDGIYGNALSIRVAAAASGDATRIDLAVLRGGIVIESWKGLSFDAADAQYVETVVNRGYGTQKASALIRVTDLLAAFPSPDNLPVAGTFGPMTGGDDGLAGIVDADFYSGVSEAGATGFFVFNQIDRLDVLAAPGRATASVHNQGITYCEVTREGHTFFVAEVPSGSTVSAARSYVNDTAALKELSEFGAIYAPWIRVDNPDATIFGNDATVVAPPSGAIVGMMCRVDAAKEGGAFTHPAGQVGVLRTARGLETNEYEDKTKRGLAFDDRINPIRAQRGKPRYVDGARCLKSTGPFPYVGASRGAMLVTNELLAAYDFERQAPIQGGLYTRLTNAANVYLRKLTRASCFFSNVPEEAFFVDFGLGLNLPANVEAAEVIGNWGLNIAPPAEFIFISLSRFQGLQSKFDAQVAAGTA